MAARLPLAINSGSIQQLQVGTPDYLDGAETLNFLAGGRLTLTSGTPVTTSDVTSASATIYYTPYLHDRISLWNGSRWTTVKFSEMTDTTLSAGAANQIYDYFIDWNGGSPILSAETAGAATGLWTNNTTRAHSLSIVNGVLVNSSNNARYVGTVRLSANGTLTDSATQRFVWNYNNRVTRCAQRINSSSHTYGTSAWREYNGSTTDIVEFIVGENEDAVNVTMFGNVQNPAVIATFTAFMGVGIDSTSPTIFTGVSTPGSTIGVSDYLVLDAMTISPSTLSTVGYHYLAACEYGSTASSNSPTFFGYTLSASVPM
jgi:hypothetical protein